ERRAGSKLLSYCAPLGPKELIIEAMLTWDVNEEELRKLLHKINAVKMKLDIPSLLFKGHQLIMLPNKMLRLSILKQQNLMS
ncbi:unnamed protein product, partial [Bubo scandiacus]